MYYFTRINTEFDHIWLIEDDVFIPSVSALINLNNKYPIADLLCAENIKNDSGETKSWPHWQKAVGKINLPWYESAVCVIRVSKRLFQKIDEYVIKHKVLLWHEMLFNIIAMHNNFLLETPSELSTIVWRRNWTFNDINRRKLNLFHPIKNFDLHSTYRKKLN